jgi:hypothetical protein
MEQLLKSPNLALFSISETESENVKLVSAPLQIKKMLPNFALLTAITENKQLSNTPDLNCLKKYHLTVRHLMATF